MSSTSALLRDGLGFDGSSVGLKSVKAGDMVVLPDLTTAFRDPFWEVPTPSFICSAFEADSRRPFARDPRTNPRRADDNLRETEVADESRWGPEHEFCVFDEVSFENEVNRAAYRLESREAAWRSGPGGHGHLIPLHGGNHAIPPKDQLYNLSAEMVLHLQSMGVVVKYHHHEVGGPGCTPMALTQRPDNPDGAGTRCGLPLGCPDGCHSAWLRGPVNPPAVPPGRRTGGCPIRGKAGPSSPARADGQPSPIIRDRLPWRGIRGTTPEGGESIQTTTVPLQIAAVALLATTMACSGASDALGSIGEPIPMGTAVVPSLDVQAWQPSSPVPIGTSQTIGNVTLSVTNVIRPANHIADDASFYSEPDRGKEFVAVDVTATWNLPSDQACSLTTADFGAEGSQGNSYHSEIVVSGVHRAFESGELTGGKSRSGFFLFLVNSDDRGLVMRFPQMFGLAGQAASFSIDG